MPIRYNSKSTLIQLGSGDVYMCPVEEAGGERKYVLLVEASPGRVGEAEDVGRSSEAPIKPGDAPPSEGSVFIESNDPLSVQMLIDTLVEYKQMLEDHDQDTE